MTDSANINGKNQIDKGFALLGITKDQYPEYRDPYSFAEGFSICSIYTEDEAVSSDASVIEKK